MIRLTLVTQLIRSKYATSEKEIEGEVVKNVEEAVYWGQLISFNRTTER